MASTSQIPQSDEMIFVQELSQSTGIDPRVLIAWIRSEGHPGDLYNNWMNITTSTARSLNIPTVGTAAAGTAEFADVQTGVAASIKEIQNLGLSHLANETPRQEISAIAASPWASSHYGGAGGPNLVATFESLYPGQVDSKYQGAGSGVIGPGGAEGAITGGISTATGAVSTAVKGAETGLDFFTSWRFWEIVGGFLLLIVGLILVGRSFGLSTPRTPLDRYADRMPTSREGTPRRTTSYTLEADRPAPKRPAASYDYGEVPF